MLDEDCILAKWQEQFCVSIKMLSHNFFFVILHLKLPVAGGPIFQVHLDKGGEYAEEEQNKYHVLGQPNELERYYGLGITSSQHFSAPLICIFSAPYIVPFHPRKEHFSAPQIQHFASPIRIFQ